MLYIQICIIGLAILLIPLLNRQCGYGQEQRLFRAVILVVMFDLVFETLGWSLDGKVFPGSYALTYAVNFFTILLQPMMGLLWLYYTFEKLGMRLPNKSPLHAVCAFPILVNALLLLTNHWTNFIFTISPDGVYTRGNLFWIDVIASFAYPVTASVLALSASKKAKNRAQKRDCYVLASFILPPVAAALIQVLWYGTFLFLIGFAIALLIVFVNLQNEQITIDFLTRTNNRASLIAYYERKVHALRPGFSLYLFMIDVDFFKRINDTYGHVIGDQVLTTVADQLKAVCAGQRCFLARLGGDEFGILLEAEHTEEARAFAERIESALDEFNGDSNLSHPVTLSVGYAACDVEDCPIDRLIQQADAMMYTKKARRHMLDATRLQ